MDKYDVCLVTLTFYPDIAATSKLMYDLATDMAEKGLKVAVFTQNRSYYDPEEKYPSSEHIRGCDVFRAALPKFDKNKAWQKSLLYLGFAREARKFQEKLNVRSVMVVFPPLFVAFHVLKVCLKRSRPFVLILHDLDPDPAIRRQQISRYNPLAVILKGQNRFLFRNASRIVVLGRDVEQYLVKEYKVLPEKISYIPNWGRELPESPLKSQITVNSMNHSFLVVYAGNFGETADLETLFRSAEEIEKNDETIHFLLVGNGRKRIFWENYVKRKGLGNITFSDFLPEDQYQELLRRASAFLVTLRETSRGLSVPSKLYYYLSAGKPILAIVPEFSETGLVINEDGSGVVCPNGAVDICVDQVLQMKNDPVYYKTLSENATNSFEKKYSQKKCTDKYYDLLQEIIQRKESFAS